MSYKGHDIGLVWLSFPTKLATSFHELFSKYFFGSQIYPIFNSDTYNDFELEVFTDRKEIYCMELKKYVDHYKKAIKFCISHFTMIELDFKLQENISKTYLFYQFFYNLSF